MKGRPKMELIVNGAFCDIFRCRNNLQAVKSQMRVQSAKSRQLISAVTNQLQTKDLEIQKVFKISCQIFWIKLFFALSKLSHLDR